MAKTIEQSDSSHVLKKDLSYLFAKRHGVVLTVEVSENTDTDSDDSQEETPAVQHILWYCNSLSFSVVSEVQRYIQQPLLYKVLEPAAFDNLLANHYDQSESSAQSMMEDLDDEADLSDIAESLPEPEDLLESQDDAPIIRLINALLTRAVKENASDIHIEVFEKRMSVRMRVDGILREVIDPPRKLAPLIISRIKVMAKLDIAEKRLPQDGRISLRVAGRPVDVRVSTLPSGHNERIVLRLLDKQAGRLNLAHLGMAADKHALLNQLILKPHGIILVTGPTGSGKTTTLYAALTQINDATRNILTVEDPVEYYIDGIGQTQVNNKVNMSFARGLRAILRQDPDVVMVGEIRDLETAEIAIQASLTGHLVFSTLHTNTAVGAVNRLRDMGVEPYLLSSSLLGVLSQRLVRILCPECKQPYHDMSAKERTILGLSSAEQTTIYKAAGCVHCNNSGYQSRMGIYELVLIDDELRAMIHNEDSEMDMEDAVRQHTPSLRQDGVRLVLEGKTSLEEILRVSREDK
jgi:general secretion pathway protein E